MKKFGCLGLILLVIVGFAVAASRGGGSTAAQANGAATSARLGEIGETLTHGNWAVTLNSVKTSDTVGTQYSQHTAQGTYLILLMTFKNVGKETTVLNSWDLALKTNDGTKYETSEDGTLALASATPAPFVGSEQIQPQLSKQYQVVFDIPKTQATYTLTVAGNLFKITAP